MYAAAGGASLASRQARQRQRQQKKTQQLQAKLHPPKASVLSVADHGASTPTRQSSRQFHQLPTNYLRAPQAHGRKLSASYTAQSKLLLPIDEGDTQSVFHMRMHSHGATTTMSSTMHMHHSHSHTHAQQQQQQHLPHHTHHHLHHQQQQQHSYPHYHGSKLVHRHSGSSGTSFHQSHLPKSATATLPLVSQMEPTPPTTPSGAVGAVKASAAATPAPSTAPAAATAIAAAISEAIDHDAIAVPSTFHDAIIVTPATPMASPGHVAKVRDELPEAAAEKQPLTADDDDEEPMEPPKGPLERKCSVYRMRRSDAFELDADGGGSGGVMEAGSVVGGGGGGAGIGGISMKRQLKELQFHQTQYEPLLTDEPQLVFKGLPNGRKFQVCAYCEEGICVCEHIECAQGRAAWLERGRRCSVQESQQQAACHRRWVKRNRIQDASLGGSSDDEDFLGVLRGPSTFANAFLYVGLGTVALGLVIAFVGTGEKGFKTVELRLIGPSLIGLGLICCILRILFCICPSHCISSSKKTRKKNCNKIDADHTTSLLRGESKRVSIARGAAMQPKYPITHKRSNSKMLNEGMEALRQIATTSLFMQNEQKTSTNRVVPIIKEPDNNVEAPLEMKKLETALNVCEISDDDEDERDDGIAINITTTSHYSTTTTKTKNKSHNTSNTPMTRKMDEAKNTTTITAATTIPTTTTTTATNSYHYSNTATTTTILANSQRAPSLSSASKLSRQRIALNQHQQDIEQSQSLSSSSPVHDSIDGDVQMETSLMILPPASVASTATTSFVSTGATPRIPTTKSTVLTAATTTPPPIASALPPPPTYTGAISRISSVSTTSQAPYDLPPATPHTYATATARTIGGSGALGGGERETLIRGPLGMPLSALTAGISSTSSAYSHLPKSASAVAVTTSAISLLPLTAPSSTATTATSNLFNQSHIPGQVIDATPSTSTSLFAAANTHLSSPHGIATISLSSSPTLLPPPPAAPTTAPSINGTAIGVAAASIQHPLTSPPPTQLIEPMQQQSQPLPPPPPTLSNKTSIPQHVFASASFRFPAPLSSASSASSSASSNGRTAMIAAVADAATAASGPSSSIGIVSNAASSSTLAPPTTASVSKFEPELLLSPAKLGQ